MAARPAPLPAEEERIYVYRGHDDDRPLLWRPHLNELVAVMDDLVNRRHKKMREVLEAAEHQDGDGQDGPRRRSRPRSGDRRSQRRSRGEDDDYEQIEEDDDYEDLGDDYDDMPMPPGGDESSNEPRGSGKASRLSPEDKEALLRAKEEHAKVDRDLGKVRREISADDVLLRLRKHQSHDLDVSAGECEDAIVQAKTWTKALDEVHVKRKGKLEDHCAKLARSERVLEECEAEIERVGEEIRDEDSRHAWAQTTFNNGTKVEHKTIEIWHDLEEELRALFKEVEGGSAGLGRELLVLTKRQQDLVVGEAEVVRRLAAQQEVLGGVEREGSRLQAYWKRYFREAEMRVSGAKAEVEAEDRARSHLAGHGDRIKAKLELTTGNLTAQKAIMDDHSEMDELLKQESDVVEKKIREVQTEIDDQEELKRGLEKQRDELQAQAQDKLEGINMSLRAIETSASAVATEQAIAQRTLQASEETLETIDVTDARNRLQEDIDALRGSLSHIEARLHEVHVERAAVREARAKTQKEALAAGARINDKVKQVDAAVEKLLEKRVRLEASQREVDGKRVVAHARVKQSKKAVTPLEQERKLYLAELEWVREFEEHSFLRMQEKHEGQLKLQKELEALRKEGSVQLKEQAEDESILKDGVRALTELREKIRLHYDHVTGKIREHKHEIALKEAEAASLSATLQALDGKEAEADDAVHELEDRRLREQGEFESADNERKARLKEWTSKQKKEQRINAALREGLKGLQAELDEVLGQLREQHHNAHNAAAMCTTLKGEKEAVDREIYATERRHEGNQNREDDLLDYSDRLRKEMNEIRRRSRR